jgi:hypothetical protein
MKSLLLFIKGEGPESRIRYSDLLQARLSGNRIPVRTRLSAPVQTPPGAHPASYTTVIGSLPGLSSRDVALTTHSHLASRLEKEWSYASTLPLGLRSLFSGDIYFLKGEIKTNNMSMM